MKEDLSCLHHRFAVLVVSCDKYSDLWGPFFEVFRRFWPDCPFNIYLQSNRIVYENAGIVTLPIGDDISWSDNLKKALDRLREEYVMLFIDDLFLHDFVTTEKVIEVFRWIGEHGVNYVRMNPTVKPDRPHNHLVGVVSPGTIYRTATVMSVWKRSLLRELLRSGESAWDFEISGTIRADKYNAFYSTWENHFPVLNGVIKGKWRNDVFRKMKSLNIAVDLARRSRMGPLESVVFFIERQRSKALSLVPSKYRRRVKDLVLRGRYGYALSKQETP